MCMVLCPHELLRNSVEFSSKPIHFTYITSVNQTSGVVKFSVLNVAKIRQLVVAFLL